MVTKLLVPTTLDRSHSMLRVVEQRHEPEVHVQLLVTVEKSQAKVIVGNEVDLASLITAQHNDILHHAGGFRSREVAQLKAVTM